MSKLDFIVLCVILIVIGLTLGGCAEWNATKIGVASHGAEASDAALETSLWQMCYASPVGAVRRRFQSAEDVRAWQDICREGNFEP